MTDERYDGPGIRDGMDAPYAVEFHDRLKSSNDRARELAREQASESRKTTDTSRETTSESRETIDVSDAKTDESERTRETVVVADEQTAPRGREGRDWSSPSGGIWFSVLVAPDAPPAATPAYTLATAVAVTETCREAGVDARIKWPNDVLVGSEGARGGRKLCGILTETVSVDGGAENATGRDTDDVPARGDRRLVIGVGWNANLDSSDLPVADATSLLAEVGEPVDRRLLLQRTLERFHDLRGDLRGALDRWRELSDTLGRRVRVETPDGAVVGRARAVEFPGALVVQTDAGEDRVITAGDCEHLRPIGGRE